MKTTTGILLLCMFMNSAFSQTNVSFALTATPLISWMKPEASEIDKGKIRAGVDGGLQVDISFKDNFAFSTGATFMAMGGNITYRDSLLFFNTGDSVFIPNTSARFRLQSLNIPLLLKLKTNQMGYITYFGSLGLVPSFVVKGRVDAEVGGNKIFDNDKIMKKKNDTGGVFEAGIFHINLQVEGGIEYAISTKTSLVLALVYNNGFLNMVKDGDDDKVLVNSVGLKIGALFHSVNK